jgi:hypothetical protein
MTTFTPVELLCRAPGTLQSRKNELILKSVSELQNTMKQTLEKFESLERRMGSFNDRIGSLEHDMRVLTTRFDLHAHKSDPTAYIQLHGFDTRNWTTEARYHNRDKPKIKEVEQQAREKIPFLPSSSSSSYSSLTGFSMPRVSDLTDTDKRQS